MTADGASLAYESAGSGEPVLFIHGAMIADSFVPLMAEETLTDKFHLVSFHRRGYGNSSSVTGPFSLVQQAGDCRDLITGLELGQVHVVGHSYGGVIALQLALDAPQMVRTLALLEPALMLGSSGDDYRNSLLSGVSRFKEIGAEKVVDEFLAMRFGGGYRQPLERMIPGVMEQAFDDAATAFNVELPALMEWNFGQNEAARVEQPVLCVLGERSRDLSPRFVETYETLMRWFNDVEGFELRDAAHGLQMEKPQQLAAGLRSFWQKHPMSA